ncbi:hypothetical protein KAOT1_03762 [Kordia algicida OT-1]|uniref:Uncharacterized protein n=1 Tax=Kordia algicida OT-1 TaxID=391587 RepID=A9DW13_9FLAO|nr:hypothetical protein KAOT1_03762 [Kordia algicida OT-1]
MKRSIVQKDMEFLKTHIASIKYEVEMLKKHAIPNLRRRQEKLMCRNCSKDEHHSFFNGF